MPWEKNTLGALHTDMSCTWARPNFECSSEAYGPWFFFFCLKQLFLHHPFQKLPVIFSSYHLCLYSNTMIVFRSREEFAAQLPFHRFCCQAHMFILKGLTRGIEGPSMDPFTACSNRALCQPLFYQSACKGWQGLGFICKIKSWTNVHHVLDTLDPAHRREPCYWY